MLRAFWASDWCGRSGTARRCNTRICRRSTFGDCMPLNVLITAGSRRVALVRAFQSAMSRLSPGSSVIVTDVNKLSPAVYAADRSYEVPLSTDPSYLDAIDAV